MDKYIKESELFKRILNVDFKHDYDGCIKFCQSIPAADVEEVRRGKWIINDNGTYSCSLCQSWIPDEQHHYARYCLYCGAKMDEEENK